MLLCHMLGASTKSHNSFDYFEKRLVNPLMRFLFVNNQTLFYASTYVSNMLSDNEVVCNVLEKLLNLQQMLKDADKEHQSLIDTVMDQTCYIDSEEELKAKYAYISDTFQSHASKALEFIFHDMHSDLEYPLKELQLMHRKENRYSVDGQLLSRDGINSHPMTKTNYVLHSKDNTQRVTEVYNLHSQWLFNPRFTEQVSTNRIQMEPINVKQKASENLKTEKNPHFLTKIDSYNKGIGTILNPYVTSKSFKPRKLKKISKKLQEDMIMVN